MNGFIYLPFVDLTLPIVKMIKSEMINLRSPKKLENECQTPIIDHNNSCLTQYKEDQPLLQHDYVLIKLRSI